MNINGKPYRTIWLGDDDGSVEIIDQTKLPFAFEIVSLRNLEDAAQAIKSMQVRGAPLIGATAAYGVALALRADPSDEGLERACAMLAATRPTAINLRWALDEMQKTIRNLKREDRIAAAYRRAAEICDEDVETCRKIGEHGLGIIRSHADKKQGESLGIHIRTAEHGGSLLLSFDDSIDLYLKDAFQPGSWPAGKWAVRADPKRLVPILGQLGDSIGLRIAASRFYRSTRDLGHWIEALKGATVLEAAASDDGSAEELKVRIGAK